MFLSTQILIILWRRAPFAIFCVAKWKYLLLLWAIRYCVVISKTIICGASSSRRTMHAFISKTNLVLDFYCTCYITDSLSYNLILHMLYLIFHNFKIYHIIYIIASAKQLSVVPHHPDAQCMHKHINFLFQIFILHIFSSIPYLRF